MRRIRVRIEEYEESEMFVEETINTTRLDLPTEALEKIKEVARGFDNEGFKERLCRRISEYRKMCKEKGYSLSPRGDTLLLLDLEQL